MTTTADHTELVHAIRLALGREDDFTIWQNSKVFYDRETGKAKAKPGLQVGASDLVGILAVPCRLADSEVTLGRMVCLEAKTGDAVLMKQQRQFRDLIRKRGGFACVVRSVADARDALERARRGATE